MSLISIIVPTHNRPLLLQRAIRSVLAQTYQNFEIIVVEDGTQDSAQKIVADFQDIRIKYFKDETLNQGGAIARNKGIAQVQGDYLAFLDDDDEWLPEKLMLQINALKQNPACKICFCGVAAYNKEQKLIYQKLPGEFGLVKPFKRLLSRCYIWTSSIMMTRDLVTAGYIFDPTLPKNQEWDLLLRIAAKYPFFAINQALTKLNILDEHEHLGGQDNIKNIILGYELFIKKHFSAYAKDKTALAIQYFQLANLYLTDQQFYQAKKLWLQAWYLKPIKPIYIYYVFSALGGRHFFNLLHHKSPK